MNEDRRARDFASGGGPATALSVLDLVMLLWRERWVMLAIGSAIVLLGALFVLQLPRTYQSTARILVLLDDAYVLNPIVGDTGAGATLSSEEIIQAEISILNSDELKRRLIRRRGLEAVYPDLAESAKPNDKARELEAVAIRDFRRSLRSGGSPDSPTITVVFKSENPQRAADTLNGLLEEYLSYRREILVDVDVALFTAERKAAEARLNQLNVALRTLLEANSIGDFESEREAAQVRGAEVETEHLRASAQLAEADARYRDLTSRRSAVPDQVELHVDDGSAQRLQELLLERQELLSRYRPDAAPVREVEARIRQLQGSIQQGAVGAGLVRRGVNPVRADLETEAVRVGAEVAALRSKVSALAQQLSAIRSRQQQLQTLAPEFRRLGSELGATQNTVDRLAVREESARARRALAEGASDNIRIIERAEPAIEGSSLRKPAALLVIALAGLTALITGLGRGLLRHFGPAMANWTAGGEDARPARGGDERRFGLPVLAIVQAPAFLDNGARA